MTSTERSIAEIISENYPGYSAAECNRLALEVQARAVALGLSPDRWLSIMMAVTKGGLIGGIQNRTIDRERAEMAGTAATPQTFARISGRTIRFGGTVTGRLTRRK